jgi:hypothetical protein
MGHALHWSTFSQMLQEASLGHEKIVDLATQIEHFLLFVLYTCLHHWLIVNRQTSKPSLWPNYLSFWFGSYAWLTSTASVLLTALLLSPFRPLYQHWPEQLATDFAGILTFVLMAYGYQLEYLMRQQVE